ncbi:hypothetical protein [Mesorhizobium sp. B2-4-17]|uniref:hypothetical protein n=1 Tax=Mesorhizobium sp. B2-4-17 TaxID=2589932 RepID=UPI001127D0C2|nr:hypothetical protein [Mesorhizobium sp. B2-4-17]TPK87365.1 hypothetical protein FJ548_14300 [Mesorhizobium sp. B2-4-17]
MPSYNQPNLTDPSTPSTEIAISVGIDAAISAIAVTGLALLVWRAIVLAWWRRDRAEEQAPERAPPPQPDGTVFRVGSLGGKPPDFLPAAIGTEIAEMIGYRQGGPDPSRLDARRTIAAHVRGCDSSLLIGERRRELPTLLLLVDRSAGARTWHRLAAEFRTVLEGRGIAAEWIDFPGTFFVRRSGMLTPRPESIAMEKAVTSSGWTVTVVFGEAHRLARSDIEFLQRLAENGPLVFLDLRDRTLWDRRHWALQQAGIKLAEATAAGLRDVLASIFAPDRTRAVEPPLKPAFEGRKLPSDDTALATLGQDGRLWASDCALIEPISFALAERLRLRYPQLATPYPSLAFSRLAALPGTWSGPEGLHFEPPMRRRLLSEFSKREAADRARTIATMDRAFAEAKPDGVSATIVHRYARGQVHVFADDLDAALGTILDIEAEGLLYEAPIRNFVTRLRVPDASKPDAGSILLPGEPRSAATRRRLFAATSDPGSLPAGISRGILPAETDSYRSGNFEITPARWSLGLPSTRIRIADPGKPDGSLGMPEWTLGAFYMGARHVLLAGGRPREQARLRLFDTLLGTMTPVATPADSTEITAIATAARVPVAVFASSSGQWYLLRLDPEASTVPDVLQPEILNVQLSMFGSSGDGAGRPPQVGIDPSGRFLFVGWPGQRELLRCQFGDLANRPTVWRFPAAVAAFAFVEETIFVGLAGGAIHSQPIDAAEFSESGLGKPFHIGGYPEAMAVVRLAASELADGRDAAGFETRDIVVAAREDGVLVCHDSERRLSEIPIDAVPRRIVPFADKKAALVIPVGSAEPSREAGLSVALLGRDGSFDIVGMPLADPTFASGRSAVFTAMSLLDRPVPAHDDRRRALAIAAQSSRVAIMVAGIAGGPARIEIRPLDYKLPSRETAPGTLSKKGERTESDVPPPIVSDAEAASLEAASSGRDRVA